MKRFFIIVILAISLSSVAQQYNKTNGVVVFSMFTSVNLETDYNYQNFNLGVILPENLYLGLIYGKKQIQNSFSVSNLTTSVNINIKGIGFEMGKAIPKLGIISIGLIHYYTHIEMKTFGREFNNSQNNTVYNHATATSITVPITVRVNLNKWLLANGRIELSNHKAVFSMGVSIVL